MMSLPTRSRRARARSAEERDHAISGPMLRSGLRAPSLAAPGVPAPALLGAVRCMSRVGKLPIKLPPTVTMHIEPCPEALLPPSRPYSKYREKYALRNSPTYDGFQAFGRPDRVRVEGPLGKLAVPIHSFCSVKVEDGSATVTPRCGGTTKLGKTLWGTTRGVLANAIRGVSQGFTKELELHGVGFRARVEPSETAAAPAGETYQTYRLGTQTYGESPFHKQGGPVELPDFSRAGVLVSGAAGGRAKRRHSMRPAVLPSNMITLGQLPGMLTGRYTRPGSQPRLEDRDIGKGTQSLMLRVGFSHEIRMDIPAHLDVSCPTQTTITISGIDRQQVGLAASRIRLLRKPDVYKGKGIRYVGEKVRLLPGKRK